MEYLGVLISLLAGLIAIRGNTWDNSKKHLRKVTITGYLTILLIFSGAVLSIIVTKKSNWAEWVSVRPVFMSLNQLNNDLGYAYTLQKLSDDGNEKAFNMLNDSEESYFQISINNSCKNFINDLDKWRLETKPDIRTSLEFVVFMCESEEFLNDRKHFFTYTKRITKDMCLMYLKKSSCQLRSNEEFIEDTKEIFLTP